MGVDPARIKAKLESNFSKCEKKFMRELSNKLVFTCNSETGTAKSTPIGGKPTTDSNLSSLAKKRTFNDFYSSGEEGKDKDTINNELDAFGSPDVKADVPKESGNLESVCKNKRRRFDEFKDERGTIDLATKTKEF